MGNFQLTQVCFKQEVGHEVNDNIYNLPKKKLNSGLLMIPLFNKDSGCLNKVCICMFLKYAWLIRY